MICETTGEGGGRTGAGGFWVGVGLVLGAVVACVVGFFEGTLFLGDLVPSETGSSSSVVERTGLWTSEAKY